MKKTLALMISAMLLSSVTGCEKSETPLHPASSPMGTTLEMELTNSCKCVPFAADSEFSGGQYTVCGNAVILCSYPAPDYIPVIGVYDMETGELQKTTIEPEEGKRCEIGGFDLRDGILTVLTETYSDTYAEKQTAFYRFDSGLHKLDIAPATGCWTQDESVYAWRCLPDGTQVISTSEGCYLEDADGVQKFSKDGFCEICLSPDGTIWIAPGNEVASRLDRSTMTLEKLEMDGIKLPHINVNNGGYYDGFGEYPILCTKEDGLYGLKPDTNEMVELVDFANSDLVDPKQFCVLPDGRFLASTFDFIMTHTDTIYLLTPRTQEELDGLCTITLAALECDQQTEYRIAKFNRQSDHYRIVYKEYFSDSSDDYNKALDTFHNDLINGIVPDIMLIESDYQMLSNKGLFEDLRPWMENDPDFHKEEYMMNVFEAMAYKGRMERIPLGFSVNCFAAKTKFIGDTGNFSAQQLLAEGLPEGMEYFQNSVGKTAVFDNIFYLSNGAFVDYEQGTCSFDGQEFLAILKLVDSLPDTMTNSDDYCIQEERVLISYALNLSSLTDYHMFHEVLFGNEDMTLLGIDCEVGAVMPSRQYAVSVHSKEKEAAWEFIKFNLQEEQQYVNSLQSAFMPVNRNALRRMFEEQIVPYENGYTRTYSMNDESVAFGAATKEEMELFLSSLSVVNAQIIQDTKIDAIVHEEVGKLFAGDCTAENAANSIQGRVMLYLAEQL